MLRNVGLAALLAFSLAAGWLAGEGADAAITPAPASSASLNLSFNVKADFGAAGNNVADDTLAVQAAYAAACAAGHAQVFWPAGQYKLSGTITINCNFVSTIGAGTNSTVIFPTNAGDTFLCAPPSGANVFGCNFRDLRIFRTDNPTAGTAIHWVGASLSLIDGVFVDGAFHDFQSTGTLDNYISNTQFGGSNGASGSALAVIEKNAASGKNSTGLHFTATEFVDQNGNTYNYGIIINNCDGCQFTNGHVGGVAGPSVYLHPINATDPIDNVYFINWDIDKGSYGLLCDTQPVGYTGNLGQIVYHGQMYNQSIDGLHNDCPALYDVHAETTTYLKIGGSAVSLSAGSNFQLQGSLFSGANNGNTGAPMVSLSGVVGEVNLDGSQFSTSASAHAVPYNLSLADGAHHIRAHGVIFTNATAGDVNMGTTGVPIDIKPHSTDQPFSVGSCTGLGTGSCSISWGDFNTGTISLSTVGSPGSSGVAVLTMPFTARLMWICTVMPWNGSGTWAGTAGLNGSGDTTTFTINWFNGGIALAGGVTYRMQYKCDAR